MKSPIMCLTEVEWREVGEYATAEHIWARNRTCPQEGEIRWCQIHLETDERLNVGYTRWLLYQTGNSLLNGIGSPEELDALTLVEAEVLAIEPGTPGQLRHSQPSQWWRVRCMRVIPLASIPQRLPSLPLTNFDDFRPRGMLDCASDKLFLYSWGDQVVETKIYVSEAAEPTHLVFYQISISNQCEIYNWPVK